MSSNPASAAVPAASSTEAPPKLKNSCDMCSASKVRCESQKPVCSRCASMGHPCSYSAARRVGRRHGRGPSYAKKRAPAVPRHYPDLLPSSHARAAGVADRRPSSTPSLSTTASSRASQQDSLSAAASLPRLEPQLPGKHSSSSLFPSAAAGQGDKYPHLCGDSRDLASHGERVVVVGRGSAPHVQQQQQQLFGGDSFRQGFPEIDMDVLHVMTCLSDSSPNNSGSRAASVAGPGSETPLVLDCAGSAMAIQEQLEATSERLRRPPGITADLDASGRLSSAMEVLGTACDRLATALVCPCSAHVDTGLLLATACVSMLDLYGALLLASSSSLSSSSAQADSPPASADDGSGALLAQSWSVPDYFSYPFSSDSSYQKSRASLAPGGERLSKGRRGEALMQVMESLPRTASLVLQFTQRYKSANSTAPLRGSCAVAPGSSELLYALASYLRVRLQSLTNEATGQLQCASWSSMI